MVEPILDSRRKHEHLGKMEKGSFRQDGGGSRRDRLTLPLYTMDLAMEFQTLRDEYAGRVGNFSTEERRVRVKGWGLRIATTRLSPIDLKEAVDQ